MARYKVLQGLNYPPDKRAEAGNIVDDLPSKSIPWLRDAGLIELVDGKPAKAETKVDEPSATELPAEEE